jgi:hypothetical protein
VGACEKGLICLLRCAGEREICVREKGVCRYVCNRDVKEREREREGGDV